MAKSAKVTQVVSEKGFTACEEPVPGGKEVSHVEY